MKTERKEELEANELEDWLTTFLNDIKPYAKLIAAVGILLAVGIFLVSYGAAQREKNRALAWTDLFSIQVNANSTFDPQQKSEYVDQLVALAKRENGSPVGAWALQYAGDISLALGSDKLWEDRDEANARFKEATTSYQSALETANHDTLRQRALLGLAQANEALKDFAAAESNYQNIISRWPESTVAESASDRLAFLTKSDSQEFYDWFLAQDPPAPQQPAAIPGLGTPGAPLTPPGSSNVPNPSGAVLDFGDVTSGLTAPESSDTSVDPDGALKVDDSVADDSVADNSVDDSATGTATEDVRAVDDASVDDASVDDATEDAADDE